MTLPPDLQNPTSESPDDPERTRELLERYVVAPNREALDPELQGFVASHAELVLAADALRASWRNELAPSVRERELGPRHAVTRPRQQGTRVRRSSSLYTRSFAKRWGAPLGLITAAVVVIAGIMFRPDITSDTLDAGSRTYATATGERTTLSLADGSRITLAPHSSLRVPSTFGTTHRTVTLEGEAMFDVSAHAGAPFVVRTGVVATRVLGTTFGVRHYQTDRLVRVNVVRGKVVSEGTTKRVILPAGTVGEVGDSVATVRPDSTARYTSWTQGQLFFYRTPTQEVLATLTRWYGYQFRLVDSALATKQLTAGIDIQSPTSAMATLKLLLDVDLAISGNVVTLSPRKASGSFEHRGRSTPLPLSHSEVGR